MIKPICKLCGSTEMRRVSRRGFFQGVVMFRAGYVPWKCPSCENPMIRVKGQRFDALPKPVGSR